MRWDARGTIALLVSARGGVTAGVVVGLTTGAPGGADARKDPSSGSTTSAPGDPLGAGVPLVNLDCNANKTILVVGFGETRGFLDNAKSANPDGGVKYLETANSCDTVYGAEYKFPPTYVAYLCPFDDPSEPCALRMSVDHPTAAVSTLRPGARNHVECLCVLQLNEDNFPQLAVGMRATTRDGIYIRALQRLLIDIDVNTAVVINGHYDSVTSRSVRELQELNALDTDPPGSVDLQTWRMLRDRACVTQDY
jgi:peptidoglycan hydrolase-like protein with peptidoglycan-binding domain